MVPLGAMLHNPSGSIGGRQPANTTMRPHMVVIVAPEPQHQTGMAERHEQCLVEAFVAQAFVEAPDIAVLLRLAGRDIVPSTGRSCVRPRIARLVGSVPLSLKIISGGLPLAAIRALSSRATREPDNEVSTTSGKHSRVKSSTTARMRMRMPLISVSLTKSRLRRWLGPCGNAIGARVPMAHLRPRRRLTRRLSSRYSCGSLLWFMTSPSQANMITKRR